VLPDFSENPFPLHSSLQDSQSLIDVVLSDKNLQRAFQSKMKLERHIIGRGSLEVRTHCPEYPRAELSALPVAPAASEARR
jgi:hypothetical protein